MLRTDYVGVSMGSKITSCELTSIHQMKDCYGLNESRYTMQKGKIFIYLQIGIEDV